MERNPYAPPTAAVIDVRAPDEDSLASHPRRFFNFLIDYFAILAAGTVIGAVTALVSPELAERIFATNEILLGVAFYLLYYIPLEASFGWTVGKLITGTRVVTATGERPRVLQIVGRTFARFIPFEVFSFLRTPSVGWHDSLSHTRVIVVRKKPGVVD